jgi:hypothetical protein
MKLRVYMSATSERETERERVRKRYIKKERVNKAKGTTEDKGR